jgi:hypothetical protein
MEFNSKEFSKNFKFLLTLFLIIIIFLVISLVLDNKNNSIGTIDLSDEFDSNISKLVINEVCSSNGGIISGDGETYDWMELYNGSKKDINLKNYGLSDTIDKIKWAFPDVTIKSKSYLVVFLSGVKRDGLFTSFALSSGGGETISIRKPNGEVIDAFETKKTDKNYSFMRNEYGEWNKTTKPTPGFENSIKGYEEYHNSLIAEKKLLKINEVLPVNRGNFIDEYGLLSSYIEVKNISDKSINLSDYFLSDEESVPFKWNMPDKVLSKNDIALIFTGSEADNEFYADFKLDSKNGYVILSKNDNTIIEKIKYEGLTNGHALVWEDKDFYETANISPGYENNSDGSKKSSSKYQTPSKGLIINEVMNSNSKYLPQNGYNFYDWIELKNNSGNTINLSDYYISKDDTDEERYKLPDINLKPNEYYVIMASGDEDLSNNSYKHVNFKLANDDSLFLFKSKKLIDSVFLYNVPENYSYGRSINDGFYYMIPTPNVKNDEGSKEISYTPEVKTLPGVFNNVTDIKVSFKYPGKLYYTTDGSNPSVNSNIYNGEIVLTKTTVIKAVSVEDGKLPSKVSTNSYIINENHTLPIMSLSLNNTEFNKVSRDAWDTGLEVSSYVEFFEGDKSFSLPYGLKLFGGATRGLPKQSYQLKFKKAYGESELHYKLFDNRNTSVYNSLVIRSGSQDYEKATIRDEVASSVVDGVTNLDVQAYKATILYINGKYYGIYFLREKVDEDFISNHYNVNPEGTNIFRIDGDTIVGNTKNYISLMSYVNSHNMAKKESYEYVASKLDIDSFIDFFIAETWITNNDIVNMRFFSNPNIENGKFNMIFYDADFAFYNTRYNYFSFITNPSGMGEKMYNNTILNGLMKNSTFKERFLERLEYNLKNVWTSKRVNDKITMLYNMIKPEMERNQSRWGLTMNTWNSSIKELRSYADNREKYLMSHIKSFFSLSSTEMKERFGG